MKYQESGNPSACFIYMFFKYTLMNINMLKYNKENSSYSAVCIKSTSYSK